MAAAACGLNRIGLEQPLRHIDSIHGLLVPHALSILSNARMTIVTENLPDDIAALKQIMPV